jgi:hypothetical protein
MKIKIFRPTENVENVMKTREAGAAGEVTGEVDIPVARLAAIGTVVSWLTTLLPVLIFWFVNKPTSDQTRRLDLYRYEVGILERALQADSAVDRRASLNLLVGLGFLEVDPNSRYSRILDPESKVPLPRWSQGGTSRTPAPNGATPNQSTTASAASSGQ